MDESERRPKGSSGGFALPRTGSRIGESLRVIGSVGGSGLGVVYECEDEAIGRRVAVKVLDPSRAAGPGRVERFLAASRAVARVASPNVVTVYDVGLYEGVPYVVMEAVPAVTLDEHRRAHGGRLRADAALDLVDGVLKGLSALHSGGIAHGGIQPHNVLVALNGRVVLTNAGLGRVVADSDHPLPAPWLDYRPEWAGPSREDDGTIDPREARADVHAAAAVLYELLTGQTPRAASEAHGGTLPAPSAIANAPVALDGPLLDALTHPDSSLLESARELRRVLESARRFVGQSAELKRILLVEDDLAVAEPLAGYLSEKLAPVDIRIAPDGPTALAIANEAPLSLVILDLGLPGMNGIELTSALRSSPRSHEVPILVLTGRGTAGDWRVLSALGANSLLMKPVSLEVVAATAEELCATRRGPRKRATP